MIPMSLKENQILSIENLFLYPKLKTMGVNQIQVANLVAPLPMGGTNTIMIQVPHQNCMKPSMYRMPTGMGESLATHPILPSLLNYCITTMMMH
jgi:hypothetical protein